MRHGWRQIQTIPTRHQMSSSLDILLKVVVIFFRLYIGAWGGDISHIDMGLARHDIKRLRDQSHSFLLSFSRIRFLLSKEGTYIFCDVFTFFLLLVSCHGNGGHVTGSDRRRPESRCRAPGKKGELDGYETCLGLRLN